jgi:hypothetical protein
MSCIGVYEPCVHPYEHPRCRDPPSHIGGLVIREVNGRSDKKVCLARSQNAVESQARSIKMDQDFTTLFTLDVPGQSFLLSITTFTRLIVVRLKNDNLPCHAGVECRTNESAKSIVHKRH